MFGIICKIKNNDNKITCLAQIESAGSAINPLPPSDAVQKQKKNILDDLSSLVLSQFKKYHPSGNLKFNNLGISQSLKSVF